MEFEIASCNVPWILNPESGGNLRIVYDSSDVDYSLRIVALCQFSYSNQVAGHDHRLRENCENKYLDDSENVGSVDHEITLHFEDCLLFGFHPEGFDSDQLTIVPSETGREYSGFYEFIEETDLLTRAKKNHPSRDWRQFVLLSDEDLLFVVATSWKWNLRSDS